MRAYRANLEDAYLTRKENSQFLVLYHKLGNFSNAGGYNFLMIASS
jgi:hypothetical protein